MKTNKYSPLDGVQFYQVKKLTNLLDFHCYTCLFTLKLLKYYKGFISKGGTFILLYPNIKLINYKNYIPLSKKIQVAFIGAGLINQYCHIPSILNQKNIKLNQLW